MTFDEWFLSKQGEAYDGMYTFARDAWNAAVEQSAAICDERAMKCERKTVDAEDDAEVTELRSMAWQFSVLAAQVRDTSFNSN